MPKPSKGRKCIVPGKVVILLCGRFRGKRVVCLKTLTSGMLLVTGPYKVNGVPLKRVNPAYVIPTSTNVDVKGCDVKDINDSFFAKTKVKSGKKGESEFFNSNGDLEMNAQEKSKMAAKKVTQKKVDESLMKVVKATEHMVGYLKCRFTLRNSMRFHEMTF